MVRFLIFLVSFLYAGDVINISYFPNDTKVDVLFSLDEPFKGKITQIDKNDYKIIGINIDRIEQKKFKQLNIIISPLNKNEVELRLVSNIKLSIKASITAKGYGLRIRILGFNKKHSTNTNINHTTTNNTDNFNIINYFIVIAILIILIIILLIVKKKTLQKLPASLQKDGYKLLYQKMIDPKNRLVLIEVFGKRYLLLLGEKNNILLDNFSTQNQEELKDISSQKSFEHLLDEKLDDDYIKKASELKDFDGI